MATVLLIEDDSHVRGFLHELLVTAGYEVEDAVDGLDGYQRFRRSPKDVVITDMRMPGQDGLETIVGIRRDFPQAKIVAISGLGFDASGSQLIAAQALGAHMVVEKPIDTRRFLSALKRLTTGSRASR